MREIDTLWVHCAATAVGWMEGQPIEAKVKEIDRWHRARGFRIFGYHFFIDRFGVVADGRPLEESGAGVRGHNARGVHICLEGGHGSNASDAFEQHFTPAQDDALRSLLARLKGRFPGAVIRGHNEVAAKACPGFHVGSWYRNQKPSDRRTLRFGSRGQDVRELQGALRLLGHFSGKVDGIFGRLTERSVMGFQKEAGLASDGIVGPRTWAALETGPKPVELRGVSTKDLRDRGSRQIKTADEIQKLELVKMAGAGVPVAGAVAEFQARLEATEQGLKDFEAEVGVEGPLAEMWPWLLLVVGLGLLAMNGRTILLAVRQRFFRTEDAQTGAHLGR